MIYFIQDGLGNIKIGYAGDVESRVRSLQTAHSTELTVLATCAGCQELESLVHWHYDAWCLRGEWFLPSPEVLALVEHVKKFGALDGHENKVAVERKPRWQRWWSLIPHDRPHATLIFNGHFVLVASHAANFFVSVDNEFSDEESTFLGRETLVGCSCGQREWGDLKIARVINEAASSYKSGNWRGVQIAAEKLTELNADAPEFYAQRLRRYALNCEIPTAGAK